jgi:metal-responsive CopG/Arc/MetJ family transcriptional regulator
MDVQDMKSRKVMVTVPEDQLRIIDGLVLQGAAPTRSALFQQIMNAFVSETRRMIGTGATPRPVNSALEGLIAYILYSLEESVIVNLFGVDIS